MVRRGAWRHQRHREASSLRATPAQGPNRRRSSPGIPLTWLEPYLALFLFLTLPLPRSRPRPLPWPLMLALSLALPLTLTW